MEPFDDLFVYTNRNIHKEVTTMKKLIAMVLCLVLALSLIGCSGKLVENTNVAVPSKSEQEIERENEAEKALEELENKEPTGEKKESSIDVRDIREDVCELYLEVLEDLWNVDSGLNGGISQIGIDLSELSHLTEAEKETVMQEFASKHNLPYIAGTWEELCEQGFIDKENLCWKDGLFFSIKTNEDAVWNLPAIKEGDPVPELTSFDAQKWRSGLGASFFGQCTAQKNADGTWSYTVGQEAIA